MVKSSVQVGLRHMKVHIDGLAGIGKRNERRFAAVAVAFQYGVGEGVAAIDSVGMIII